MSEFNGKLTTGYRSIEEQRALWAKFAKSVRNATGPLRRVRYRLQGVTPLYSRYTLGEAELRRDRRNRV